MVGIGNGSLATIRPITGMLSSSSTALAARWNPSAIAMATDFPSSSGYGTPIQKLLKFRDGEVIIESFGIKGGDSRIAPEDQQYRFVHEGQEMVLVSRKGTGFALGVTGLEGVKRSGKRVMKLRADDALAAVCRRDGKIAVFTEKGCGLVISMREVPVREQAAVGVALMGVRKGDRVVSCHSFKKTARFVLHLVDQKSKELSSSSMLSGRRSLKGRKVISRGQLRGVEKVIEGNAQFSFL